MFFYLVLTSLSALVLTPLSALVLTPLSALVLTPLVSTGPAPNRPLPPTPDDEDAANRTLVMRRQREAQRAQQASSSSSSSSSNSSSGVTSNNSRSSVNTDHRRQKPSAVARRRDAVKLSSVVAAGARRAAASKPLANGLESSKGESAVKSCQAVRRPLETAASYGGASSSPGVGAKMRSCSDSSCDMARLSSASIQDNKSNASRLSKITPTDAWLVSSGNKTEGGSFHASPGPSAPTLSKTCSETSICSSAAGPGGSSFSQPRVSEIHGYPSSSQPCNSGAQFAAQASPQLGRPHQTSSNSPQLGQNASKTSYNSAQMGQNSPQLSRNSTQFDAEFAELSANANGPAGSDTTSSPAQHRRNESDSRVGLLRRQHTDIALARRSHLFGGRGGGPRDEAQVVLTNFVAMGDTSRNSLRRQSSLDSDLHISSASFLSSNEMDLQPHLVRAPNSPHALSHHQDRRSGGGVDSSSPVGGGAPGSRTSSVLPDLLPQSAIASRGGSPMVPAPSRRIFPTSQQLYPTSAGVMAQQQRRQSPKDRRNSEPQNIHTKAVVPQNRKKGIFSPFQRAPPSTPVSSSKSPPSTSGNLMTRQNTSPNLLASNSSSPFNRGASSFRSNQSPQVQRHVFTNNSNVASASSSAHSDATIRADDLIYTASTYAVPLDPSDAMKVSGALENEDTPEMHSAGCVIITAVSD
ncbi:hypothetical protein FHG87_008466 [Trinorchestia longiramus]|nr:hypothetical protein FHG87_008466 [Trinorchestia longiramus]